MGLRFDYFNTQFTSSNPFALGPFGLLGDGATVNSQGWIPLFGTQYAYTSPTTNLTVRAVGVPTLLGNVKYTETLGATGSAQFSGTYNGGYFLEVFSEYLPCVWARRSWSLRSLEHDTWKVEFGSEHRFIGQQRLRSGPQQDFLDLWRQFHPELQYPVMTT